jgi:hypothetical protein
MAYETSLTPIGVTFNQAGETETHAFDAGSGANRVLVVGVVWRDQSNTISGVTYNGVAMTSLGAKVTEDARTSMQLWRLANPASGSNNIAVTMGAGDNNSGGVIGAWVGNGADVSGTPVDGYQTGQGNASTANVVSSLGTPVSSAAGDRVVAFFGQFNESANLTATAANYTERQDGNDGAGISLTYGDADGAATVDPQATWSNGAFLVRWVAMGLNVNAAAGGANVVPVVIVKQRQNAAL